MAENIFNIKSRIFKRERVRENRNNIVIVSKRSEDVSKNQIELSWKNTELDKTHLSIVGRVTIKEWERQVSNYPITRSFMQVRENQDTRLYISFQVVDDLNSKEIRSIVDTVTVILEECLEKVMKKVDIPLPINEDKEEIKLELNNEPVQRKDVVANNELIVKLHKEIEEQETLLQQLTNQQDVLQQNSLEEQYKQRVASLELLNNQKESIISELRGQVTAKEDEIEKLNKQIMKSESINLELDKANVKLNEVVQQNKIDAKFLEKAINLENDFKEIKKENSDYRIQLNESQHIVEQYKNTTGHLKESFGRLETTHKEFIEQAQVDINNLETELKETEKKVLIETNERQKVEIQLDETQKKLAQEIRTVEKKEDRVKSLNLDLNRQLKQRESANKQVGQLEKNIDMLKADLKMSQVTNEMLKIELASFEEQQDKLAKLSQWEIKYEDLEAKFDDLQGESSAYRQEIMLLTSQLNSIEKELFITNEAEENSSISYSVQPEIVKGELQKIDKFILDDDDDYFLYEEDPYVEEVITEELMNIRKKDQMRDEKVIKELLEAYDEEGFKDIKVDRDEYRKHVLSFKFLSFRWSQVFIINELDKNAAFLEWCAPFIRKIESFEEELSFDVKKSFFTKNYVTMDESTYEILKGYSKLSTYLDTYYLKVSYYIDKYFLNEGNRGNNAK